MMRLYTEKQERESRTLQHKSSASRQASIDDILKGEKKQPKVGLQEFNIDGENHHLWVDYEGHQIVPMVASDPVTIPQQLRSWRKKADKMEIGPLKDQVLYWLASAWDKLQLLTNASTEPDPEKRNLLIHDRCANLKVIMEKLFWWDKKSDSSLSIGAASLYRGLHFSKDWETKRGRSVADECKRLVEDIREESAYSAATWQLASDATWLKYRNQTVMDTIGGWKSTTDLNRLNNNKISKNRKNQIERLASIPNRNQQQESLLEKLRKDQNKYSGPYGWTFSNRFQAQLSHYIHAQQEFEDGLKKDRHIPFSQTPFISTTKVSRQAVKYAQGKLSDERVRSVEGDVGKVLIYVAPYKDIVEAGGIDVWEKQKAGELSFTDWRMNENEVTFAGKIPENFLVSQKIVRGNSWIQGSLSNQVLDSSIKLLEKCMNICTSSGLNTESRLRGAEVIVKLDEYVSSKQDEKWKAKDYEIVIANEIEMEAAKEASKYGGLKPLPINE